MPRHHYALTLASAGLLCACLGTVLLPAAVLADDTASIEQTTDFTQMSLEELMTIDVTSVSKKKQSLSDSAAAIFVVTQEDIRRSGVSSIPEALRMVPGIEVARIDGNKWAISSRGFNDRFTNKLLVLIDGRTIYNPLFAGVTWENVDLILSDIERIEVIRGPGGTIWGVNAVNGVINIITKSSRDTQGGLLAAWGGSEEGIGELRYGGSLNDDFTYRVFGKYFNRDTQYAKPSAHDDWRMGRGGFRADWNATDHDVFMIDGGLYGGNAGHRTTIATLTAPFSQALTEDSKQAGGHLLGNWKHTFSERSDLAVQLYYDHAQRDEAVHDYTLDRFDMNVQHRFPFLSSQEITWGGEYRYWMDDFQGSVTINPDQRRRSFNLVSGFLQDEVTLIPDELIVTVGTKLTHNDFTGFEYQPSGHVLWKPKPRHTLWGAVSRAVVIPPRLLDDGTLTVTSGFGPIVVKDNQEVKTEVLYSFEVGYRGQLLPQLSADVTGFIMDYDRLVGSQLESMPPASTFVTTVRTNNHKATNYGAEVAINIEPWKGWTLRGAYSYLKMKIKDNAVAPFPEGVSPTHHASLRSLLSLPGNVEFDAWLRYNDNLPALNVKAYTELDLRLGWRPITQLELSLVGQNLLHKQRNQFSDSILGTHRTSIQRSVLGKATWHF